MGRTKSKRKPRSSGVAMTTNRRGEITFRSYGPNAPDLRDALPGLFSGTRAAQDPELTETAKEADTGSKGEIK